MRATQAAIIAAAIALSVAAGACVAGAPAVTTIPAPRYAVIADIATMERQIADLQNDVRVLQLLRAHDIQLHQRERAEDLKRIIALEWALQGQSWPACAR